MNVERELSRIDDKLMSFVRADVAYNDLLRAGGVNRQLAISLESIQPGVLLDLKLPGGFTQEVSNRHYAVSLEQASVLRHLLFSATFAAILYFFVKMVGDSGIFGSGGSAGGDSGGGGGTNFDKRKRKAVKSLDDAEAKLAKKLHKIKENTDLTGLAIHKALDDRAYAFLERIGVDKTIVDAIRNTPTKAKSYFLDMNIDDRSQFMHDVFVYEVNRRMCMIITHADYAEFQKNAIVIAGVINDGREQRVQMLERTCKSMEEDLRILTNQFDIRTLTSQADELRYVEHPTNDPDDILKFRKLFTWPDTKTARTISLEMKNMFVTWMQPAADAQHNYKFKSRKDFESRCLPELFTLIDTFESYQQYMVKHGKHLCDELVSLESKINAMRVELLNEMDEFRKADGYSETNEGNPTTQMYQHVQIVRELEKASQFIHSYTITTNTFMSAMATGASLARMVYGVYSKGYKINQEASAIADSIMSQLKISEDDLGK